MGTHLDIPLPDQQPRLHIILERVQHPGNLGAIARSMLNFGITDLHLIDPACDLNGDEARNRAKHAGRVLDGATIHKDWSTMAPLSWLVGTSGKREHGSKTLRRHFIQPWEFTSTFPGRAGDVGLVFGAEGMGLDAASLARCDTLVTIPTWEGYPILNLAHSVTTLLWEVHRMRILDMKSRSEGLPRTVPLERMLDPEIRISLRRAIDAYANQLSGTDEKNESVAATLTRTILRGVPNDDEATRLIGALIEGTTAMEFAGEDPAWHRDRRRRL